MPFSLAISGTKGIVCLISRLASVPLVATLIQLRARRRLPLSVRHGATTRARGKARAEFREQVLYFRADLENARAYCKVVN